MSKKVVVYSKPNCVQCNATYRELAKLGVDHTVVDVSQDKEAYEKIIALGYKSVPVVIVDEDSHWGGFNSSKIKELAVK